MEKEEKTGGAEANGDGGNGGKSGSSAEDISALMRALEKERGERKKLEERHASAAAEVEKIREDRDNMLKGATPKADVERLEASWNDKFLKAQTEHARMLSERDALISERDKVIHGMIVDSAAKTLANEISTVPDLMEGFIKPRLRAEIVDGKPCMRVLDENGNLSAMTFDELKKSITDNAKFAAIIKGSSASGSATGGIQNPQSGAGQGGNSLSGGKVNLDQYVERLKVKNPHLRSAGN